jgi:hypothetical protein
MHFMIIYKPGTITNSDGTVTDNAKLAEKILQDLNNGASVAFPDSFTVFQRVCKESEYLPIDPNKYPKDAYE